MTDGQKKAAGVAAFVLGICVALYIFSTTGSSTTSPPKPSSSTTMQQAVSFCSSGLVGSLDAFEADGDAAAIYFWKGLVEGYNLYNCAHSINVFVNHNRQQLVLLLTTPPRTLTVTGLGAPMTFTIPGTT